MKYSALAIIVMGMLIVGNQVQAALEETPVKITGRDATHKEEPVLITGNTSEYKCRQFGGKYLNKKKCLAAVDENEKKLMEKYEKFSKPENPGDAYREDIAAKHGFLEGYKQNVENCKKYCN